ncbi:unnamed protein product [Pleuronectes platessa]|uniref:Uncharacterized protein n=1 Tax=Pleuronectes platessa TaxID=8262 RepID=A0A9N7USE0_PLEPL|nr:unnamed protein product [Pleuronectes platessa]
MWRTPEKTSTWNDKENGRALADEDQRWAGNGNRGFPQRNEYIVNDPSVPRNDPVHTLKSFALLAQCRIAWLLLSDSLSLLLLLASLGGGLSVSKRSATSTWDWLNSAEQMGVNWVYPRRASLTLNTGTRCGLPFQFTRGSARQVAKSHASQPQFQSTVLAAANSPPLPLGHQSNEGDEVGEGASSV